MSVLDRSRPIYTEPGLEGISICYLKDTDEWVVEDQEDREQILEHVPDAKFFNPGPSPKAERAGRRNPALPLVPASEPLDEVGTRKPAASAMHPPAARAPTAKTPPTNRDGSA